MSYATPKRNSLVTNGRFAHAVTGVADGWMQAPYFENSPPPPFPVQQVNGKKSLHPNLTEKNTEILAKTFFIFSFHLNSTEKATEFFWLRHSFFFWSLLNSVDTGLLKSFLGYTSDSIKSLHEFQETQYLRIQLTCSCLSV